MVNTAFQKPIKLGGLVGYTRRGGKYAQAEYTGRVVEINCKTVTIITVDLDGATERRTGESHRVPKGDVWWLPTPAEIASKGAAEREIALKKKDGEIVRREYVPGIRVVSEDLFAPQ
jgi:hypothetical protein